MDLQKISMCFIFLILFGDTVALDDEFFSDSEDWMVKSQLPLWVYCDLSLQGLCSGIILKGPSMEHFPSTMMLYDIVVLS